MLNRETKGVILIFVAIFLSAAAVFGILLAGAGAGDLETNFNCVPWWAFFVMAFLCGAGAGFKHVAAVAAPGAAKRARLMKWHFRWWLATVPLLAVSFWIFWLGICVAWIWFGAAAAALAAMFAVDRKS